MLRAGEYIIVPTTYQPGDVGNEMLLAALRAEMRRRAVAANSSDGVSRVSATTRASAASTPGVLYRQGLERMVAEAHGTPMASFDDGPVTL